MCFPSSLNCLHSIAYDVAVQAHRPPLPVLYAHAESMRSEMVKKKTKKKTQQTLGNSKKG